MEGLSEIIIGIVIINVLFRVIRGFTSKDKKKPSRASKVKETWEPPWKPEEEPVAPEVTVDKFETLMGETETVPPAPIAHGDEEKSWVEDLFETIESEFKQEEAPSYDMVPAYDELPSYDEKAAAAKGPETPKLTKTAKPPEARRKPAKRPVKTVAPETAASVLDALGDKSSIRTAIVLSTVLGPCRAKQRRRPGHSRIG